MSLAANCVLCDVNLSTNTNSYIISRNLNLDFPPDDNLLLLLCKCLDIELRRKTEPDNGEECCENSKDWQKLSSFPHFCSDCKEMVVTLKTLHGRIEQLQCDMSDVITKITSRVIKSSESQTHVKKECEDEDEISQNAFAKFTSSPTHKSTSRRREIVLFRTQVHERFCPLLNEPDLNTNENSVVKQEDSDSGDLDYDSDINFYDGEDDHDKNDEKMLHESPSEAEEPGLLLGMKSKGKHEKFQKSCAKSKPESKSKLNEEKERRTGNSEPKLKSVRKVYKRKDSRIDNLGEGQFMYRGHLPFQRMSDDSSSAGCRFKCGVCESWMPTQNGILNHLRTHDTINPSRPRRQRCHGKQAQKQEQGRSDSGGEGSRSRSKSSNKSPLFVSDCGEEGKFTAGGKWVFYKIPNNSSVTDDEPFKFRCDVCNEITSTRRRMIRHIRERHKEPVRFVCDICGREFHVKQNFDNHQLIHMNVHPFVCEVCGTAFKYKAYFVQHQKSHQDLYQCHLCPKKLQSSFGLRRHLENHDGATVLKCDQCDKSFLKKDQLRIHTRRVHKKSY